MYVLSEFDGLALPVGSPKHVAGTAASRLGLVQVLGGGVYDAQGAQRAPAALPYALSYSVKAVETSATALQATLDGLRGLRGKRGRLYRRALDYGGLQWATARLLEVEYSTEAKHSHGLFQPLTLQWQVLSQWHGGEHGAGWTLASGEYLDEGLYLDTMSRYTLPSGLTALSVTNHGNGQVDDAVLTYTAGGSNCTGLTIRCGGCELVYAGTVAAGESLVIDCGARSVRNDGADDYARLTLGANHAAEAWMRLEPGANAMTVTRTGGGTGSVLTVGFWDGWE